MIINTAPRTTHHLQINLNERLLNELDVIEQFNIHELLEIGLNNLFKKLNKYGFCTILSNRINENLIGNYQLKIVHIQKYQLEKLDNLIYNLNRSDLIKIHRKHKGFNKFNINKFEL